MKHPANLVVFISGGGSNLKALIDANQAGELDITINRVIADRDCQGKMHAFAANIPFTLVDRKLPAHEFVERLLDAIPKETDLIVLAGFLTVIPKQLTHAFTRKIINLHPSLLPKYGGKGMYGLRVHQAVIDAGESGSGASIHYVDEGVDTGEVIAQTQVPVLKTDSAESLQQRVQAKEHILLVETVNNLVQSL